MLFSAILMVDLSGSLRVNLNSTTRSTRVFSKFCHRLFQRKKPDSQANFWVTAYWQLGLRVPDELALRHILPLLGWCPGKGGLPEHCLLRPAVPRQRPGAVVPVSTCTLALGRQLPTFSAGPLPCSPHPVLSSGAVWSRPLRVGPCAHCWLRGSGSALPGV